MTDTAATKSDLRKYAATLAALKTVPTVAAAAQAAADQFNAAWTAGTLTVAEVSDTVHALRSQVRETFGADSDEHLAVDAAEYLAGYRNGFSRASSYLLAVPFEARGAVRREANLQANCTGMRYADAVQARAASWRQSVEDDKRERTFV